MTNSLGMSLASFSFTASEMGPNMTTGLLKPAVRNNEKNTIQSQVKRKNSRQPKAFVCERAEGKFFVYLHATPLSHRQGIVW